MLACSRFCIFLQARFTASKIICFAAITRGMSDICDDIFSFVKEGESFFCKLDLSFPCMFSSPIPYMATHIPISNEISLIRAAISMITS